MSEKEKVSTLSAVKADLLNSWANKPTTRRTFLKVSGLGGLSTIALHLIGCAAKPTPTPTRTVYVPDATMMIVHDTTRCVGCRRCEIACTEYNEGRTQPSLARIKINRNYLFGPKGAQAGFWNAEGVYGNHRLIGDTCRQCPHPVPCMDACPYGAIEVVAPTNARVVNVEKCKGCRTCQRACPWAMTVFDEAAKKASKCHLCGGDPQCVKACPTGALIYVPWTDKTKEVPIRFAPSVELPPDVAASCIVCHGTPASPASK